MASTHSTKTVETKTETTKTTTMETIVSDDGRRSWRSMWWDPSTFRGALLIAVLGAAIVTAVVALL